MNKSEQKIEFEKNVMRLAKDVFFETQEHYGVHDPRTIAAREMYIIDRQSWKDARFKHGVSR